MILEPSCRQGRYTFTFYNLPPMVGNCVLSGPQELAATWQPSWPLAGASWLAGLLVGDWAAAAAPQSAL